METGAPISAHPPRAALPLLGLSVVLLLAGCGGPRVGQEITTQTPVLLPGIPEFEMEATTTWRDSISVVRIYLDLPHKSLTYVKAEGGYQASFEITASVLRPDDRSVVREETWDDTSHTALYRVTEDMAAIRIERSLRVPPGRYLLELRVLDENSRKEAIRSEPISPFSVVPGRPVIGRVVLEEQKADGQFAPVLGFHLQMARDSLRSTVEAFGFPSRVPARAMISLLRYHADTSIAKLPFAFDTDIPTLMKQLIDIAHPDTVRQVEEVIAGDSSVAPISFAIPRNERGLFSVDFRILSPLTAPDRDTTLKAIRFFTINGPSFPRLSTIEGAIEAMVYVTNREEQQLFRETTGEAARHRLFDSLWLSFAGSPLKASELIKKYYYRVEEANRLFTTTKDGWRTDQGMIYIVFGRPITVDQRTDVQSWYYEIPEGGFTFYFKRVFLPADWLSIKSYFLLRSGAYEHYWQGAVDRWRTGRVF